MPFKWKGHTFYRPAELRAMSPEQREQVRAAHRANPVPQELLRQYAPQPEEDDIDRELRAMLEAGEE